MEIGISHSPRPRPNQTKRNQQKKTHSKLSKCVAVTEQQTTTIHANNSNDGICRSIVDDESSTDCIFNKSTQQAAKKMFAVTLLENTTSHGFIELRFKLVFRACTHIYLSQCRAHTEKVLAKRGWKFYTFIYCETL